MSKCAACMQQKKGKWKEPRCGLGRQDQRSDMLHEAQHSRVQTIQGRCMSHSMSITLGR